MPSERKGNVMKVTLLVSLLTFAVGTAFATTTDELRLIVGSLTATITDNGACSGTGCAFLNATDTNVVNGITSETGTIGGWTISYATGTTFSPVATPVGLDLGAFTATCNSSCAGSPLVVQFSDINFTPAFGSFTLGYTLTSLT